MAIVSFAYMPDLNINQEDYGWQALLCREVDMEEFLNIVASIKFHSFHFGSHDNF